MNKEVKKRKFVLDENTLYSLRKLKNVSIENFRDCIKSIDKKYLNETELRTIETARDIVSKMLCENKKIEENESYCINYASKIYSHKIPLKVRQNISLFEEAHKIKTMFYEKNSNNQRGENFKITLNE